MIKFLEEAKQLIINTFPDDWWIEFGFDKDSTTAITDFDQKKRNFTNKLTQAKEAVFESLNESILVGEYIESDSIEGDLSELIDQLERVPQPPTPIPEIQEVLESVLIRNFIDCIEVGIYLYRDFYTTIKNRITYSSKYYLLQFNSELNERLKNRRDFETDSQRLLDFIFANLTVARVDHFMRANNGDFNTLYELSLDLVQSGKLGRRKHSILLLGKCQYLLNKWLLRKRHFYKKPVYIIKNSQEEEINVPLESGIYSKWIRYIQSHYELSSDEWRGTVTQNFDDVRAKDISHMVWADIHCAIKYYKDVDKSSDLLKQLREEVEKKYKELKRHGSLFDRHAASITLNYTINNEFSLLLEETSLSEGKAEEFYSKVTSIQAETGVKNFFPQYKYLKYLVDKLEYKYSHREAISNIVQLREIINKCKRVFERYEENIEWSQKNYNYVCQMPFQECLITVGSNSPEKIFIASSFILPLIKENYIKEYDELKKKVLNFESSVEIIENVGKELQTISTVKSKYDELAGSIEARNQENEKSLREKEIKYVEAVGIFAAIVTFVASTIPGFQFIKTAYQAGVFVLSLGTAFSFFVLLLLVAYKGISVLKSHVGLLIVIGVITLLSWFFLIYRTKDPELSAEKVGAVELKRIDSLYNVKIDSTGKNIKQHVNQKIDSLFNNSQKDSHNVGIIIHR